VRPRWRSILRGAGRGAASHPRGDPEASWSSRHARCSERAGVAAVETCRPFAVGDAASRTMAAITPGGATTRLRALDSPPAVSEAGDDAQPIPPRRRLRARDLRPQPLLGRAADLARARSALADSAMALVIWGASAWGAPASCDAELARPGRPRPRGPRPGGASPRCRSPAPPGRSSAASQRIRHRRRRRTSARRLRAIVHGELPARGMAAMSIRRSTPRRRPAVATREAPKPARHARDRRLRSPRRHSRAAVADLRPAMPAGLFSRATSARRLA
jgi:hypothetical protein